MIEEKLDKTYVGNPGTRRVVVLHVTEKGEKDFYELPPRNDVVNHSPTGFSWGFLGSGPAQLALAILLDMGLQEHVALRYYQNLKMKLIAKLPQEESFKLTEAAVLDALFGDKLDAFLEKQK